MQFEMTPALFLAAASFVAGLCKGKTSTMPILKNVVIDSKGTERLQISATDIETFAVVSAPATVRVEGSLCVPGDLLIDMVREAKDQTALTVQALEKGHAQVRVGDADYRIVGLDPKNYPLIEAVLGETPRAKAAIQGEALASLLKGVLHTAPKDATMANRGIHLEFANAKVRATATDGHRLATAAVDAVINVEPGPGTDGNILISSDCARKLVDLGTTATGWIELIVTKAALRATAEGKDGLKLTVGARLLVGSFPKWRDVVRTKHATRVTVETKKLLAALDRASILTGPLTQGIQLDVTGKALQMTVKNPEAGEMNETLATRCEGLDTKITANVAYLLDALTGVKAEETEIALEGSQGAIQVQDPKDTAQGYMALVMPMRE